MPDVVPPVQPVAHRAVAWSNLPLASSCLSAAVGGLALIGWAFGLPALVGNPPGPNSALPTTAGGLFGAAAAVWLLTRRRGATSRDRVRRVVGRTLAIAVAAMGLVGLTGLVGGVGPELDVDSISRIASRLGPVLAGAALLPSLAALWFALLGTALVWHEMTTRTESPEAVTTLPSALAGLAFMIAFLALVGCAHRVMDLYAVRASQGLALATAASFMLLALSVLLAVPHGKLAGVLTGEDAGAVVARRLLPAAILIPVVLAGWSTALQNAGGLEGSLVPPAHTAIESFLLLGLVFWTGHRLRDIDLERLGLFDAERRTRAEAETLAHELQRRTNLLEQTSDAVFAWTLGEPNSYRIVHWTRGAEALYGYPREEALGRVSHELMGAEGPSNVRAFETFLRSKGSWAGQLRHITKDGRRLVVESRQVLVTEADGNTLVLESNRDVTEQVRSAAFARLLGDVAHAANAAGRIEDALQVTIDEVCAMLRWPVGHAYLAPREKWGAFSATSIWHLDSPARHESFRTATEQAELRIDEGLLGRAAGSAAAVCVDDVTSDTGFRRRDAASQAGLATGAAVPVLVESEVVGVLEFFTTAREPVDEDVLGVLAQVGVQVGRVVERQWLQEVRRLILDRVITAQEDERRRIARELHDSVGQHLTALLLGLGSLRDVCRTDPVSGARLAALEGLAHTMGQETRDLALNLRPVVLDDLGLASALSEYAHRWSSQSGISADVHIADFGPERLYNTAETALYRVVQEALTNVARHAGASQVSIILQTAESGAQAIVEDNGKGFDPDQLLRLPAAGRRLGLLGMQERIALVGGTFAVESSPGSGTTVFARVPLAAGDGSVAPRTEGDRA